MARDVTGDNYYMSSKGKIPVKWTAPEVYMFLKWLLQLTLHPYNDAWFMFRHCSVKDIQFRVMFGAMGVCCMKYGVLDTNHLKGSTQHRLDS